MSKKVLTAQDVKNLPPGSPCYVEVGTILTPLAQEMAQQRGNVIMECATPEEVASFKAHHKCLALGADRIEWTVKERLRTFLQDNGYWVLDCSPENREEVDGLDIVLQVARWVKVGKALRGIMIDGMGIASCMVANKVPGIRAVHAYDRLTAQISREYNDANLLTLAGQLISFDLATLIVTTWLNTPFSGKQHQWRVSKIEEIEQQFLQTRVVASPGDSSCAL